MIVLLLLSSCKSEKKESIKDSEIKQETTNNENQRLFEKSLIDLRDVGQEFIEGFEVKKFGINKVNDSTLFYVLKLSESTLEETVQKYSVGSKAYNNDSDKIILSRSYSPSIKYRDDEKYLLLRILPTNWTYMDSIDFYIYARKDWKSSGRLGGVKIRDVLIEN